MMDHTGTQSQQTKCGGQWVGQQGTDQQQQAG